jgi:hypothetical protein
MYYVQPILEDEDLWMTNGMPLHHAIMRGDQRSLSNPKRANVKCGTPWMGHAVRVRGILEIALGPIQEKIMYDFFKGFKNIDEVEIRAVV